MQTSGKKMEEMGGRMCPLSVPLMIGVKVLTGGAKGILIGILMTFRRPEAELRLTGARQELVIISLGMKQLVVTGGQR